MTGEPRLNAIHEPRDRAGRVVGQEAHVHGVAEQAFGARPSGRSRGGQHQRRLGMARAQGAHQRRGGRHFAQTDRVQPQRRLRRAPAAAETLPQP